MKLRFGLIIALLAFFACRRAPVEPTPVNVSVQVIQTQGGSPGPGTSPSPGTGGPCIIARNRVGFFGISCPSGVAPRNGQGVLPLGCTGSETATPKLADGTDATIAQHGPTCLWAIPIGAERVRSVEVSEVFNRNVVATAVGDVQISATISPPACGQIVGFHDFQVTQPTSSSGELVALSSVRIARAGDEHDFYRDDDRGETGSPRWRLMGRWRVGDPIPKAWKHQ